MDDKSMNLLQLFNDSVKRIQNELNISEDKAFIKMLETMTTAHTIYNYVVKIKEKEVKE